MSHFPALSLPALAANVLGFMSCQATDIGQPHEAALLADTAISGYPDGSARVSAILNLRSAATP